MRTRIGLLVGFLLCLAVPGSAASITLFNTGVTEDGSALLGFGATDPHYQIFISPDPSLGPEAYTPSNDGAFPFGFWLPQGPDSKWITPVVDAGTTVLDGYYTYRTTFDLGGLDPSTASITGKWSTDNEGNGIFLNGISTGNTIPSPISFTSFHDFSINTGFIAGLNTLDFIVLNDLQATGNPSGLRVEMSGTAAPVPEPGTMMLLGSGLIGLAGWGRKKFKK